MNINWEEFNRGFEEEGGSKCAMNVPLIQKGIDAFNSGAEMFKNVSNLAIPALLNMGRGASRQGQIPPVVIADKPPNPLSTARGLGHAVSVNEFGKTASFSDALTWALKNRVANQVINEATGTQPTPTTTGISPTTQSDPSPSPEDLKIVAAHPEMAELLQNPDTRKYLENLLKEEK